MDISIPIIDDTIPQEPDRTFNVSIVPNSNIIPPDTDPMVTVVDDDGKRTDHNNCYKCLMMSTVVIVTMVAVSYCT